MGNNVVKMKPTVLYLDPAVIIVPEGVRRPEDPKADQVLKTSITHAGVQQPLVALTDGESIVLVDGTRRLRFAIALGIPKVPVVVEQLPAGETDAESYARRLRFILDEHRQDLLPSQRAQLVAKVKTDMGLNNLQLATYLGVNHDSISNWTAMLDYIPEVVRAIDTGYLTLQSARVFGGMSEEGQRKVWTKHEAELVNKDNRRTIHKRLRREYPPEKFPAYYERPKATAGLLAGAKARTRGSRKANGTAIVRAGFDAAEKKKLLANVELKEEELLLLKDEIKECARQNQAAAPIVAALLRNPKLKKLVPESMIAELERFAEVYC